MRCLFKKVLLFITLIEPGNAVNVVVAEALTHQGAVQ